MRSVLVAYLFAGVILGGHRVPPHLAALWAIYFPLHALAFWLVRRGYVMCVVRFVLAILNAISEFGWECVRIIRIFLPF